MTVYSVHMQCMHLRYFSPSALSPLSDPRLFRAQLILKVVPLQKLAQFFSSERDDREDIGRQHLTFPPEGCTSVLCFLGFRCWKKTRRDCSKWTFYPKGLPPARAVPVPDSRGTTLIKQRGDLCEILSQTDLCATCCPASCWSQELDTSLNF